MADLIALRLPGKALGEHLKKVWAAGDAALPLDPSMRPEETRKVLEAARPAAIVTAGGVEALLGASPVDDGVALAVLTSGTTGEPKAAMLSHEALDASARASLRRIGATSEDVWLACLPLYGIAGIGILYRSRVGGIPVVVHPRFDIEMFDRQLGVNVVSLVPTMLRRLLDTGVDLARFKAILLGGAAPQASLVERARAAGANIVETYGMTETCGGCFYDGRPLDGVTARIGERGEIMIQGPVLMSGYRPAGPNPIEDGWLHTADAGEFDDEGTLRVLGRLDDLIITGGKNVAPAEVEAVLAGHPLVADVAVSSRPDDEWGRRVVAFVVAAGAVDASTLRAYAKARLSGHKVPKEYVFLGEIPRNPAGKIDRSALSRASRLSFEP